MRDPLRSPPSQILKSWTATLLVVAIVAFLAWLSYFKATIPVSTLAEGQVVGFGSFPSSEGDQPIVHVRFSDGTKQSFTTQYSAIKNCELGSRILLRPTPQGTGIAYVGCPNSPVN